ncbi:PDDEXK nuclease domain-containing protein [Microbacterium sp. H83]|uniref:PDDEXK nuclease domain-containing protein n=1 Tax=Microbacterium sp. H83 TaxID=1827324 RepID=UPI000AE57522|nr:PDDEXK nuclease domain-containing protein [Microbacterium sp. H83]
MGDLIPGDYAETLENIKREVRSARLQAQRRANTELLRLYWRLGREISLRQASSGWGSKVLERLASDLRAAFPRWWDSPARISSTCGESRRPGRSKRTSSSSLLDNCRGTHLTLILDKVKDQRARDWYAAKAVRNGWTRALLTHHLTTHLHERDSAAIDNFVETLPVERGLARELTKDPYALQFLAVDGDASERELEQGLVDRILETMRELGQGFAFVRRQVHLSVGESDFFVDLLFFHVEQLRYVVIELKTTAFTPADAGQLGFYVAVVDESIRLRDKHAPTIGILLVAGKNDTVVRYALASTSQPVAVSRYELSAEDQRSLPDEGALTRAFIADPPPSAKG